MRSWKTTLATRYTAAKQANGKQPQQVFTKNCTAQPWNDKNFYPRGRNDKFEARLAKKHQTGFPPIKGKVLFPVFSGHFYAATFKRQCKKRMEATRATADAKAVLADTQAQLTATQTELAAALTAQKENADLRADMLIIYEGAE